MSPSDWGDFLARTSTPRQPTAGNVTNIDDARTRAYVNAAIERELEALGSMGKDTGRNAALNDAALKLGTLPTDREVLRGRLLDACQRNGVLAEDGQRQCEATIDSGFSAADREGPRVIPDGQRMDFEEVSAESLGGAAPPPPPPGHHLDRIVAAEGDFWQRRTSLTHIYDAALGRMCAPWAVLAHCAARALYQVRPWATLPSLIGGPGSLNWFSIVVAPSGGGKSAAEDVARELINQPIEQRSLGSGEGFLESYIRPENKETGEPRGMHMAIMFLADESDTVSSLTGRSGSTLLSTLRTAWTGGALSFGYRGRTAERLEAHSYRATLVMAMQPSRAGWILEDGGGGTPQRFNWFPGVDRRITVEAWNGGHIDQLDLPSWREWDYGITLTIPDEARDLILSERAKAARGEQAALDGHALFCREKFAYALAVLDGRAEMNLEDWELSGVAADVSTATRQWVIDAAAGEADRAAVEKGRLMGASASASDDEKAYRSAQRSNRIGALVLDKLASEGPMTDQRLRREIAHRDRPWLAAVIDGLHSAGLILRDEEKRWAKK